MRSILPLFLFSLANSGPAIAAEWVPVAPFRSVDLRGGGEVVLTRGPVQRVTLIEGSTRFTRLRVDGQRRLRIEACNRQCPRNYRLRIQIQSPTVPDAAVTGGGAIRAAGGFAAQHQISAAITGGGKIDIRSVEARDVSAAITGGGQILVRPRLSLSAAIMGGGEIRYSGNPRVSSAIHGGGIVRPGT